MSTLRTAAELLYGSTCWAPLWDWLPDEFQILFVIIIHNDLEARHTQRLSPPCARSIQIRYFSDPRRSHAQSNTINEVRVGLEVLV